MEEDKKVYNLLFPAIYRYFYYKQVCRDDIPDLCQESFMRLFNKYRVEELPEIDLRKLSYTISRNVYKEWVRNQIRQQHCELDEDIACSDNEVEFLNSFDDSEEEIDNSKLTQALGKLSQTFQIVLRMRLMEGASRAEVAQCLGVKDKHVHVYQRRALVALRKELEKLE